MQDVFFQSIPQAVENARQHIVDLDNVQEHIDIHERVQVLLALHGVRLGGQPDILLRRHRRHDECHVPVVHGVEERKRAHCVGLGLGELDARDARGDPVRGLRAFVGVEVALARLRIRHDVLQQLRGAVVHPVRLPVDALRAAPEVCGQRPGAVDPRVGEANIARESRKEAPRRHAPRSVIYQIARFYESRARRLLETQQAPLPLPARAPRALLVLTLAQQRHVRELSGPRQPHAEH